MPPREALRFLNRFLSSPLTVGAFVPSSTRLAEMMIDWIDWSSVHNVVEYGAGTGVFTHAIARRMLPGTRVLAVELDPLLAEVAARRVPDACVCIDSVANIETICRAKGIGTVDSIISGLPWAIFGRKQQVEMLGATKRLLRSGGYFATFAYPQGLLAPAGRRFGRLLLSEFTSVQRTRLVWRNFPPAFVYRCRNK
jgi:phosphatidylethanolamine/phosphatidyl-N-methylethanolamine N-methyltransferase